MRTESVLERSIVQGAFFHRHRVNEGTGEVFEIDPEGTETKVGTLNLHTGRDAVLGGWLNDHTRNHDKLRGAITSLSQRTGNSTNLIRNMLKYARDLENSNRHLGRFEKEHGKGPVKVTTTLEIPQ
jgi:hypothetical protein